MTTYSPQDEGRGLAPQNLVQPDRREGRIVVGKENSEHGGGQRSMFGNVIGLLATMRADYVPQNVNSPDFPRIRAYPVDLFSRAVGIFDPAFWTQLSV